MSWSTDDWQRRDDEVRYTYGRDPDRPGYSIYFPRDIHPDLYIPMQLYLEQRALSYSLARQNGWYPATYNGPRIIIPCLRTDEKNFWQGRLIDGTARPVPEMGAMKRWESPRGPRGDALCFMETPGADTMVVVEGPMDALAAAMVGASAIATLGVGAPGPVLAHAASLAQRYKRVILVPDRDEVGAWIRIQKELGRMGAVAEIREPQAKDLADLNPERRANLIHG